MKKGKTLTVLVLAIEILSIAVLHAVKISKTEKAINKEISRNSAADQPDSRTQSTYSLAVFK
jgi:Tfp pilus assembly protein PilV